VGAAVSFRSWLRPWVPPIVAGMRRSSSAPAPGIAFRGDFARWEDAVRESAGYDQFAILEKVRAATEKVERGEAAYERDSVLFHDAELSYPMLTGLLWAAVRDGGRLSVMDFGGSLGTAFRQHRRFLQGIQVRWGVVEQPHYVNCGRQSFTTDALSFHESIAECAALIDPNVIVIGAALQYVAEPFTVLADLARSSARVMIVDRTPFSDRAEDGITVQHVSPAIYDASYPSWIFSEAAFRARVGDSWSIKSVYTTHDGAFTTDRGLHFTFKGFLLTR
jgi:putative methyltransferase (TIGR04325 family)